MWNGPTNLPDKKREHILSSSTSADESKSWVGQRLQLSPASSVTSGISIKSLPARVPSLTNDERKKLNVEAYAAWKKNKAKQINFLVITFWTFRWYSPASSSPQTPKARENIKEIQQIYHQLASQPSPIIKEAERKEKARKERERIERDKKEKEEKQKQFEAENRERWLQRKKQLEEAGRQKAHEEQKKKKLDQEEQRQLSKEMVATWMTVARNRPKPVKGGVFGELLNLPPKHELKPDAVPHLLLPGTAEADSKTRSGAERKARAAKRNSKKELEMLLRLEEEAFVDNPDHSLVEEETDEGSPTKKPAEVVFLICENKKLKQEIKHLQEQLSTAREEILKLKNASQVLEGTFSACQQQVLTKGRCRTWSSDDIAKAVTLRCISYKALGFVRDVLKHPLPSEMTIKRRLRQFNVCPGFIDLSIRILQAQSSVFSDFERDVVLSFDEMKVNGALCFDKIQEVIRGPHNNVQVMVIRSLIGKWMQPIYYNFDTPVRKDLFMETVNIIEKTGFKVRACVCDMGGSNQKLMTDLDISFERCSIKNPECEERNIWMFSDIPHALKLLRNHLLDDGYLLEGGKTVTKDAFVRLVEIQRNGGDLKYAHKISTHHLLVTGTERQNVRKAAELCSGTTGRAISYKFPEFQHVGDFVITVNNGFDVLNSRVPVCSTNNLKSAYGNSMEDQDYALDKLYKLIFSMRAMGKKRSTLLPFQKGFLLSINSIRGLYNELKGEGYTYLMTSKCNQDVLESYFSQIRGIGRFYDHPLPNTVSQRMKSLLLSRNAGKVINSENILFGKELQTLSADLVADISDDQSNQNETNFEVNDSPDEANQNVFSENTLEHAEDDDESAVDGFLAHCGEGNLHLNETSDIKEEKELLELIAGYIAYRVRKKTPEKASYYGCFTKDAPSFGNNWLQALSRGRLMKPSKNCIDSVELMEREFQKFHGNYINRCPGVFSKLIEKINQTHPGIDGFVVSCYVRTRTFMRMKCLNLKKTEEKRLRSRRSASESQDRQKKKKMSKIIM